MKSKQAFEKLLRSARGRKIEVVFIQSSRKDGSYYPFDRTLMLAGVSNPPSWEDVCTLAHEIGRHETSKERTS